MFNTTSIEEFVLSRMYPDTIPSRENHLRRKQIEAMASCPRCLAHTGYRCITNGLDDRPHAERVKAYDEWKQRLANLGKEI
jgi:hypothetical protein